VLNKHRLRCIADRGATLVHHVDRLGRGGVSVYDMFDKLLLLFLQFLLGSRIFQFYSGLCSSYRRFLN